MPQNVCRFSFNIAAWQASSSKISTPEQWQDWAQGKLDTASLPEYKPALSFLPPMQRRRLGKAARLVCDAAWNLADQYPESVPVYVSHDGESNRSFELWQELLNTHTVSPTSFGLSVHNATIGQWSMLRKDMSEHTALAVAADSFETALTEAFALLQDGAPSVLIIVADDPLSGDYPVLATRAPFAYALALVITKGEDYTLSLETTSERPSENPNDTTVEPYWSSLEWVRFLLSDGRQHTQHYAGRNWHWQKNA